MHHGHRSALRLGFGSHRLPVQPQRLGLATSQQGDLPNQEGDSCLLVLARMPSARPADSARRGSELLEFQDRPGPWLCDPWPSHRRLHLHLGVLPSKMRNLSPTSLAMFGLRNFLVRNNHKFPFGFVYIRLKIGEHFTHRSPHDFFKHLGQFTAKNDFFLSIEAL